MSDDLDENDTSKKQKESNEISISDTAFIIPENSPMGYLCKNFDWSTTALGPTSQWPQSLRTAVSMCLTNKFPSMVMWGPDLTQIYNEGFVEILEGRHPAALGAPGRVTWWDVWDVVGPMYENVVSTGEPLFLQDYLFLPLNTKGQRVERYFTYAYSPIYAEGKVSGVLTTVSETGDKIFNFRQLRTMGEVASHATEASATEEACSIIGRTLATNPYDITFASIYLGDSTKLVLIEVVHINKGTEITPKTVQIGTLYESTKQENFANAVLSVASTGVVEDFILENYEVPKSAIWTDSRFDTKPIITQLCCILPLQSASKGISFGVLVIGITPTRDYDESYSSFLKMLAGQTSAVISNARAHEEEKQKAEILAELDRSKTLFFSNISHEFRTPITLMLGPLEDMMEKEKKLPETSNQLELIHRNALRLLKLVNTLLDFSQIEAGRMEGHFEAMNLSQTTSDLASIFRSACERVGLDLIVECPTLSDSVWIDIDMYEKIVLNLISNAYKFTMNGYIAVRVKELGKMAVQVSVEDTGVGVPEEEIPRLFERFHRVPDTSGRTHEGTGIGLAMVNGLVKLHGGTIQAYSRLGQGSIFVVTLPYGTNHLPPDRTQLHHKGVLSANRRPSYARTAEWWVGKSDAKIPTVPEIENKPRIMVVDDNSDMREYLYNLLHDSYDVELACDGVQALELISRKLPELVLTDVMMPKLDGFGLLQILREDEKTRTIPVIFLSARAGEESRVEGLTVGADDYLTKPFTARELLARIKTHLNLFHIRKESATLAEAASHAKDHFLAVLSHELRTPLTPALLLAESMANDEALPKTVRRDLDIITKSIKLEVRLIDDLLDVTKITKNKLVLSVKDVNVHHELLQAIDSLKHEAENKQIDIETDFSAQDFHIKADPQRLEQIFWNITKNAIKFTPENGRIRITTRNDLTGQILIEVIDSGIGIETKLLPKIFESFQLHQFGGLGLGLSISKTLVTMMSGIISASSDGIGHGTAFSVSFPTIEHIADPSPTIAPTNSKVPPQRILLTEDDKSTSLVMSRFLKKLGHSVKTANCVKEAMEIAASFKFDLVISDVRLPDGSGYELMKSLRSIYGLRGICVTGYGMDEDIKHSIASGFDIHVVKPVEVLALQSAIAFVVIQKNVNM